MENEPEKPQSSVPPPPDLPPPPSSVPPPPDLPKPSAAMPPPPDLPPPPPPMAEPKVISSEPKPVSAPKAEAAKIDSDEEDPPVNGAQATFESRVIASIIDSFVGLGVYIVLGMVARPLGTLGLLAYALVKDALPFLEGQSIGKKVMKIKAVELDGKSLSGNWQATVVRNLPMVIPFFGLVEAYILYSKKDQDVPLRRLGDEWGKTKVVVAVPPAAV